MPINLVFILCGFIMGPRDEQRQGEGCYQHPRPYTGALPSHTTVSLCQPHYTGLCTILQGRFWGLYLYMRCGIIISCAAFVSLDGPVRLLGRGMPAGAPGHRENKKEERDEYVAGLNGVEFVCDEPEDGFVEEAQKLSKLYFEKLPKCSNLYCPNYSRFMGT